MSIYEEVIPFSSVCCSVLHFCEYLLPIACGVSFYHNFQPQSPWSLFNRTWQKRPRELEHSLRFEIEVMTLQMK